MCIPQQMTSLFCTSGRQQGRAAGQGSRAAQTAAAARTVARAAHCPAPGLPGRQVQLCVLLIKQLAIIVGSHQLREKMTSRLEPFVRHGQPFACWGARWLDTRLQTTLHCLRLRRLQRTCPKGAKLSALMSTAWSCTTRRSCCCAGSWPAGGCCGRSSAACEAAAEAAAGGGVAMLPRAAGAMNDDFRGTERRAAASCEGAAALQAAVGGCGLVRAIPLLAAVCEQRSEWQGASAGPGDRGG